MFVISVATWRKLKDDVIYDIRIALRAVPPTPKLAIRAEEYLIGEETSE